MASSFKKMIMMANQIDDEPSLPKEYMQLEYLESTGTQYIDTGFIPRDEAWAEIDAQKTSGTDTQLFYAQNATDGSSTIRFQTNLYQTGQVFFRYGNSSTSKYVTNTNYKRHYYRMDHTNCYIDGINVLTHGNTASLNSYTKSVTLFSATKTDGSLNLPFSGRVFCAKFGIGEMCSLNLIPALRIVDSKPGMYDLVSGQFFTNQGTGEFVFEMPNITDTQKPYLCFEAVEDDFQAKYSINPCEYSVDDRKTWNELPADTLTPAISAGSKIYFRGKGLKNSSNSRGTFSTTKLFNISGNMLSMVHGSDFLTGKPDDYACAYMFRGNKNIVSISDDFFNIKNSFRAFQFIFDSSSLTNVNIYNVNNGLYMYAFKNSMLKKVTFFAKDSCSVQCFTDAFYNTSIEELDIPYKYIQYGALQSVASSCKYLKKVIIRATSIAYDESLTAYSTYFTSAFSNCPLLNNVTFLVANIPLSKRISNNWLTNVAEKGIIILNKNITWNPEDYRNGNIDNIEGSVTLGETITWGIPAGWEIKYCDPDNISDVRDYREIDKAWD